MQPVQHRPTQGEHRYIDFNVREDEVPMPLMDTQWTRRRFDRRLREVVREVVESGKSNCGCGLSAIRDRCNDFAFGLKKFGMIKGHTCVGCQLGKGALEDELYLLWRSSLPAGRDFIYKEYYQLVQHCLSFCQHGINKVFKERTAMFKMGGEYIHPHWQLGCYWEQLCTNTVLIVYELEDVF